MFPAGGERLQSTGQLQRVLGAGFGVSVVMGGMVGQGILRAPGVVASATDHEWLILLLWIVGGAVTIVSAFALIELGTAIPSAGGPYVFIRRAYGPNAGNVMGCADWMNSVIAQAYLSVVLAEFLQRFLIFQHVPTGIIAPAAILLFWAVNWTGTYASGMSQNIGTALKGAGLGALVCILFFFGGNIGHTNLERSSPVTFAATLIALRAIWNTYDGGANAVYFSEEIEKPERNLPRAVIGGMLLVTALYTLMNAALLHVLTPDQIAASKLPASDAAALVLGSAAGTVILIYGIVSVAAITNLNLMFSSRIPFAMAREGALPNIFARVSRSGTPRVALTLTAATAASLAASGTYMQLVAMDVGISVTMVLALNMALIRLRRKEPKLPRPFTVPFYPIPILLTLAIYGCLLAALIYEEPLETLSGIAALAIAALLYGTFQMLRAK